MLSKENKTQFIQNMLEKRKSEDRFRTLKSVKPISAVEVIMNGHKLVNFSSNDYLGLSKHPYVKQRSIDWIERYGNGATASRLICGNVDGLEQIEEKLAALKSSETALILNSGFQTNITLIPALADRNTLILSDELNHNSIVQGCTLARCDKLIFRHNDTTHLKQLLKDNQDKGYSRILIITETIFSMDGDCCDLKALRELSQQFNAILIVDEAHATGVTGPNGMGLANGEMAEIVVGTFGKACGSFGSYIACDQSTRDYLINYCSGLIFSTALPPSVLGAIDAALDIVPKMQSERKLLHEKATFLRSSLKKLGYKPGQSTSQIIPVIIGDNVKTLKLATKLEQNNVLATAIRPPTVPKGTARIRIALSSEHSWEQIDHLLKLFKEYADAN
ncbi:MAG: 8-amino-7-oxononanoate synthase [Porticoccaceae bacterium]|nr:8-amino-7-oxononanoate synthase [Porticoccaceae bacterium]